MNIPEGLKKLSKTWQHYINNLINVVNEQQILIKALEQDNPESDNYYCPGWDYKKKVFMPKRALINFDFDEMDCISTRISVYKKDNELTIQGDRGIIVRPQANNTIRVYPDYLRIPEK